MKIEVTDQMIYAYAGEPEITGADAHAIRVGLTAVFALIEREQKEMGVWSGENPVRNAERGGAAERRREESRARLDDANTAAQGSKLTLAELRRQRKG